MRYSELDIKILNVLTFFVIITPRDWIRSSKGALHEEYNILSLILQLYPGMLYIKTKRNKKVIHSYHTGTQQSDILLLIAYLCFLCNLLREYA